MKRNSYLFTWKFNRDGRLVLVKIISFDCNVLQVFWAVEQNKSNKKTCPLTLALASELSVLISPRFELPRHLVSRRFVDDVPPSKSGQESTTDVLDQPEIGRQQNGDRHKRHDVTQSWNFKKIKWKLLFAKCRCFYFGRCVFNTELPSYFYSREKWYYTNERNNPS